MREIIACFPRLSHVVRAAEGQVSETDARHVDRGGRRRPRRTGPTSMPELFDFVRDVLLLQAAPATWKAEFVMRFQQVTGPVMAKGVEDTAFYNYNRLIALNEVGGDPSRFGYSLEEFHAACRRRQRLWPESMLATTTHDTKRSEDVRARLALFSEMPQAGRDAVADWAEHNERHRTRRAARAELRVLPSTKRWSAPGRCPVGPSRDVGDQSGPRGQAAHVVDRAQAPTTKQAVARVRRGGTGRPRIRRRAWRRLSGR